MNNKSDLIRYLLENGHFKKKVNIYELFSIMTDYELFDLKKDKLYMKDSGTEISFYVPNEPLLNIYDIVTLNPGDMSIVKSKIETTIGRVYVNYILLEWSINGKLPYINEKINLQNHTNVTLINMLLDGRITIDEYLNTSIGITVMRSLSRLFVISDTRKTMTPPPNINKLKEEKILELKRLYGDDALTNYEHLFTLTKYLQDIDDDWLKNDPTYGLLTSGKVKDVSRTMKHLMYGDPSTLKVNATTADTIVRSLSDGYGVDPEIIAKFFNSIRAGSFSRGNETKLGGEVSNIITRAMVNYHRADVIDCGTKYRRNLLVTKSNINYLKRRNYDGTLVIGNIIKIRTSMGCKLDGEKYCHTCLGEDMARHKYGIIKMAIGVAGGMVDAFLAKMHGSSVQIKELDIKDL